MLNKYTNEIQGSHTTTIHAELYLCASSKMTWNKFFQKVLLLFCAVTVAIFFIFTRTAKNMNSSPARPTNKPSQYRSYNTTEQFKRIPSKGDAVDKLRRPFKKIFIAFDYWEQLTAATNNFLGLTALAAYSGRQVVVPFVKDSFFLGTSTRKGFETLELYYNVSALNHTLRSRGYGTLISWKEFQDVCQGKLDMLVHFDYTNLNKTARYNQDTRAYFPCNNYLNTFWNLKVERTICMNVFAVDSVEKFENEVIKRLPCVGFDQWRGTDNKYPYRAQFDLSSVVTNPMPSHQAAIFFSSKLLHVARDFIAKSLGPLFFSIHIRVERILKLARTFRDMATVKECISNLTARVQRHKNFSTALVPVFLASDFAEYGSSSRLARQARQRSKSLMNILAPLKPVIFQPSAYNLSDRGAVAIVEMNILVSGEHLFVVGGGTFQKWIANQFLNKKNVGGKSSTNCENKLCNSLCCL